MMRTGRDVADQLSAHMHGRNQRDVGEMRPADEGIVDDNDIARIQRADRSDGWADGLQHGAQMNRHMLGLGDQLGFGVEYGARGIHALLDVGREGRELQHPAHLLRRGLERVAQHLERDRVDGRCWIAHRPALHQQRAIGMDAGAIAGVEDRSRGHFLDHRRSLDHVVCKQLLAREYPSRDPASGLARRIAFEKHIPRRGVRLGGRGRASCGEHRQLGRVDLADSGGAEGDDLDRRLGVGVAESVAVGGMEVRCQARPGTRIAMSVDNRQLVALAHVSGFDTHLDQALARRYAVGGKQAIRGIAQALRDGRRALGVAGGVWENVGLHQVVAQIGEQLAQRAQDAGSRRNDEPPDLQLARDRRAVHRPGAAERHQRALARVVAALDRYDADAAHDVGVRHAKHTHRSRNDIDAERFGDVGFDRVSGSSEIEPQIAAEPRFASQPARARGWRRRSSAGYRHDRSRPAPARPPHSSARRATRHRRRSRRSSRRLRRWR